MRKVAKTKIQKSFFGFVLGFSLLFLFGAIRPASAVESVLINAKTIKQSGTANGARLGINTDYFWDDQANRPAGTPSLSDAVAKMHVKYMRYPGGEKADGYLWSVPPFTAPAPRLARISLMDWPSSDYYYWQPRGAVTGTWAHPIYDFDEFMSDCRAVNCEPVIVVAYDGAYKAPNSGGDSLTFSEALDTAVAWVRYANLVKGYNVKYWEIGNETYLPGYMGADPGRAQQAYDLITFSRAMKAVDPTIKIGTNANGKSAWSTLLSIAGADVDFLSVHTYPALGKKSYANYQSSNLNPNAKVNDAYDALKLYPSLLGRVKIMVTETGGMTFGSGGGTWTQCDLGHALMTFDTMAKLLQNSLVEFTQFWNTRWINNTESEYYALKASTNEYTAQGWAIHILGNYTLNQMVAATGTANVVAFASYDSATLRMKVFLINKATTAMTSTVTLQNYSAPLSANVSALTGTGPADTNPVFAPKGTISVGGNQFTITLDPVSITVIELR